MRSIPGVTVAVFQNDQPIVIQEDGYLGRLSAEQIRLQVNVAPSFSIHGFMVDGLKNIIPSKNYVEDPTSGKLYELKITIQKSPQGSGYTVYPGNNLRLAEQLDQDPSFDATGAVQLWEIAVISQNGDFFVTIQNTYSVECFQVGDGFLTYPRFQEDWPQIDEFLVSLVPDSVMPGPISAYEPEEKLPSYDLKGNEGRVLWFNEAQGLGALLLKNGTARVHWSQVEKRSRRVHLQAGQKVIFQQLRQPKQTKMRNTSFKQEAVGVIPV